MEIETWGADRLAYELAALLAGGWVEVFGADGARLVSAAVGEFRAPESGVIAAYPFPPALGEGDGVPVRFEAFAADGRRVLAGTCGHESDEPVPEMRFRVRQIIQGADVIIDAFVLSVAGST